ncbi:hypothetical protein RU97_GL000201 [Enterococcus canis]|uniref:Uncharacterized protein n=1 Tax=Enterococcus canis TaxID=214095 RepID=A0A1L8RJP5_9ENTE|nr:hypothetical protein [Enterococcus canis]OJG19968.1 hypothetical protein RU97_GL000201 [Enterococcus canis]
MWKWFEGIGCILLGLANIWLFRSSTFWLLGFLLLAYGIYVLTRNQH